MCGALSCCFDGGRFTLKSVEGEGSSVCLCVCDPDSSGSRNTLF